MCMHVSCVCVFSHPSFATHLQTAKQVLGFFHFTLQFGIPAEEIADSKHCPPLESSQSQHFPGQKPLFNMFFSKEPGFFGLLSSLLPSVFLWAKHSTSLLHQGTICVSIQGLWEQSKLLKLAREAMVKTICFWILHAFYSISALKLTYVNHQVLKMEIIFQLKKSYLYKSIRKQH